MAKQEIKMKFSRRDRAVLVLAYEHLRDSYEGSRNRDNAPNALHAAFCAMASFSEEHYTSLRRIVFQETQKVIDAETSEEARQICRTMRVRLALYIRTILRADRGDYGKLRCGKCGSKVITDWTCARPSRLEVWCSKERIWRDAEKFPPTRRFEALWETAYNVRRSCPTKRSASAG